MGEKGYHFIGLGGIGMSALASILLDQQASVTGSDIVENAMIKKLSHKGAAFTLGHAQHNVTSGQTVVYSSEVTNQNLEMQAAIALQCKLLHRSDLLKELMEGYQSIAVAGTHGKTTTSALLTHTLTHAGFDPSYAIGGLLNGENGRSGKGKYFVAEADESDGTFLKYHPFGAIVTNVEKEHMNHYQNEERLYDSFRQFFQQVGSSDHLLYCGDDPKLPYLAQGKGLSYGFGKDCQLQILAFNQKGWKINFDIAFQGKTYYDVEVSLVGKMHALNATAVFGLCLQLGISEEKIRKALISFPGVKRRLEKKGEVRNILFLDDYGHHPTEIKVTLCALKEAINDRRLIVLFQPHRFTRTRDFLSEFSKAFESADFVFVTDIYGAQEYAIDGITAEVVVEHILQQGTIPASYLPRTGFVNHLKNFLRPHDVVVTMGAGDVTSFSLPLLNELEANPPKKYHLGLIFGGRSAEHEISLRSCRFIQESLNPDYYDISYFGIDKKGDWIVGNEAKRCLLEATEVTSSQAKPLLSSEITTALKECDVFFPVLHGPNGEDGTIQGFFEMLGKPYAGPDFRSCAVTMDKVMTKRLLISAGVPTSNYISFSYHEWLNYKEDLLKKIQQLNFPLFIKPSRMGSSIGVSRVDDFVDLSKAIENAFHYDEIVLIEEGVVNARELEFGIMGSASRNIEVPIPGEKCAEGSFVDYHKKYSQHPVQTTINPILDVETLRKGRELAKRAYEVVGISCMSRVDALLDPSGNFFFFEINAIPGLTKLSLFPKMWARDGVGGPQLVDRMIQSGLARRFHQNRHEKMV